MNLVTGGTGLLGSHLLFQLAAGHKPVRALKRQGSDTSTVKKIFRYYGDTNLSLYERIEWAEGDMLDYDSLTEATKGVDTVYHAAATVSFYRQRHKEMWEINVDGTRNIIDAAMISGVRRFCHVSSIATLGNGINGNATTEDDQWQPDEHHSVYSKSKFMSEMEVWRAAEEGLSILIVNPSVIIGPGAANSSMAKIIGLAQRGMPFYTSGSTGYVDVRDVAQFTIRLTEEGIGNERFIISAENKTTQEILGLMAHRLNTKPPHLEAKKWMINIAVFADSITSFILRREPSLTYESAKAASGKSAYTSEKIKKRLNVSFTPISEAVENAIKYYQFNG